MAIGFTPILTAVAALIAVLALVCLIGRLARFSGISPHLPAGRMLAVQDVLPLDARRRLYLVRCGQRRILLLTGGAQDTVVGWFDQQEPPQ